MQLVLPLYFALLTAASVSPEDRQRFPDSSYCNEQLCNISRAVSICHKESLRVGTPPHIKEYWCLLKERLDQQFQIWSLVASMDWFPEDKPLKLWKLRVLLGEERYWNGVLGPPIPDDLALFLLPYWLEYYPPENSK